MIILVIYYHGMPTYAINRRFTPKKLEAIEIEKYKRRTSRYWIELSYKVFTARKENKDYLFTLKADKDVSPATNIQRYIDVRMQYMLDLVIQCD